VSKSIGHRPHAKSFASYSVLWISDIATARGSDCRVVSPRSCRSSLCKRNSRCTFGRKRRYRPRLQNRCELRGVADTTSSGRTLLLVILSWRALSAAILQMAKAGLRIFHGTNGPGRQSILRLSPTEGACTWRNAWNIAVAALDQRNRSDSCVLWQRGQMNLANSIPGVGSRVAMTATNRSSTGSPLHSSQTWLRRSTK